MKAAKFTQLTVSGKLYSVFIVMSLLHRTVFQIFPPEDWRIKAAEGDGQPGDGFRREE